MFWQLDQQTIFLDLEDSVDDREYRRLEKQDRSSPLSDFTAKFMSSGIGKFHQKLWKEICWNNIKTYLQKEGSDYNCSSKKKHNRRVGFRPKRWGTVDRQWKSVWI